MLTVTTLNSIYEIDRDRHKVRRTSISEPSQRMKEQDDGQGWMDMLNVLLCSHPAGDTTLMILWGVSSSEEKGTYIRCSETSSVGSIQSDPPTALYRVKREQVPELLRGLAEDVSNQTGEAG